MNLKKTILLLITFFCMIGAVYAEDWEPSVYDNEKLSKANDTVKEYIIKNGTYLSGTENFSFYYMKNVKITYDSINATGSDNAIVSIVYKGQAWFLEFHGRDYNGEGQINYSVLDMNSPVIYFKFSTISAMNTVLISYDGADFFVNTIDSKSATYYPSWGEESCEEYNAIMEIPFKYSYLQGKKILNEKESQYVYTDRNNPRDDYNDNHMFTFLGIQGVSFLKDVYFQTYITDDNLRLRTSNSKDGNVITHLSKGTEVRVINIDPAKTQMEGKAGFWVLIETNDRYVGWIWSNYLKNFDYDFK